MFQILHMTEAHVASVTNRVEKHGDEDKPAVSLGLELTASNTLLDLIDPKIRTALYTAVEGQEDLPGVETSTPLLRCHSFDRHTLATSHEGWTLAVDDGADETTPMVFGGAKVDKFVVEAKQGGTIVLRFRVGTSDVDAEKLGKLAMHNGGLIWVTLTAPVRQPDAADASRAAPDLPPSAEDLFSAGADAGEAGDAGGVDADRTMSHEEFGNAAAEEIARIEGEPSNFASTRTARGREQTKAALAAGLAAHKGALADTEGPGNLKGKKRREQTGAPQ